MPWKHSQPDLWEVFPRMFGFEPEQVWKMRAAIAEHLPLILQDALQGQCTKGHSCKHGSKEALESLLQLASAEGPPALNEQTI
jgi:hypothetical protein